MADNLEKDVVLRDDCECCNAATVTTCGDCYSERYDRSCPDMHPLEAVPYTDEELDRMKHLKCAGLLTVLCTKCGTMWVRDYPYPVRKCPACGEWKPWADKGDNE